LGQTKGPFVATGYTLQRLVAFAYGVELFQVSDGPGWANSERYDITAKKESDQLLAKPDDDRYRTRAILESRFHLIVHRESKELPICALVDTMTNTRATLITSTIIGIVATSGESTAGTVAGPLFGSG